MFKPTKEQILQAWEDRDEGKPLSKDMELYLDKLEAQEQANALDAEETGKLARREELVNLEVSMWQKIYKQSKGVPIPQDIEKELRQQLKRHL